MRLVAWSGAVSFRAQTCWTGESVNVIAESHVSRLRSFREVLICSLRGFLSPAALESTFLRRREGLSSSSSPSPVSSSSAAPRSDDCCTVISMLVSGHRPVMYTVNERRFRAVGSAPAAQMSLCQHVSGQYSSTQTGPVGGVWAALLDCIAFGTYFPAGVALTEPPRSRNRPAVLLAVHCVTEDQPHRTA